MELIAIQKLMDILMKVNEKIMRNMGKVKKIGPMVVCIKVHM